MTVHRSTPLPVAPGRGHLVVAEHTLMVTARVLRNEGCRTPPHEGLVWWLGRRIGDDTYALSVAAPQVDSGPQHVFADESTVGDAAAAARRLRLGVVAQVHSHPGADTRHSDGDDHLVLMPFEGMFSIVVANYGSGSVEHADAGLHQFQDGRWVQVCDAQRVLVVTPEVISP